MSIASEIISSMTQAGQTSAIPGVIGRLAAGGGGDLFTRQKVVQICGVILANNGNPVIVMDSAKNLAELPGIPASVAAMASQLMAMANNPVEVMQIVAAIETAEGHQGLGSLGLGLL